MVELAVRQLAMAIAADECGILVMSTTGDVMLLQTARIGLPTDEAPRFVGADTPIVLLNAVVFVRMRGHDFNSYVGENDFVDLMKLAASPSLRFGGAHWDQSLTEFACPSSTEPSGP